MLQSQRILILDFGSQLTQLIARRVREAGVYSEIYPWDVDPQEIISFAPRGIILSGGGDSTLGENPPVAPAVVFTMNVPVLGICYGMQTMAQQLGGQVAMGEKQEFGLAHLQQRPCRLFDGLNLAQVWMSHGDKVSALPPGFQTVASSDNTEIAAMADEARHFYGVQFHPEVTHTPAGFALLKRFVLELCGCEPQWNMGNFIAESLQEIRERVGSEKVLLALSGGVDSSVVASLLHRAIGAQLTCVFVDTGLLRLNEGDQVMELFRDHLGINVIRVNAGERFLGALAGVADPEAKRKIIGRLFVEIFEEEGKKIRDVAWLAQGTIYPDVIESAGAKTGKAKVIKSHHNVGGLPEHMNLKLLEPIRDLFKDEVRALGEQLGLPRALLYRHPFPGPGLAVRVLGEVKADYLPPLQRADHIFLEELRRADLYGQVSQAFAVFLPVRSVAVMGDGRRYDHVIALRAVETVDFMTARWAPLPYDFLDLVSRRIINEIPGISRVVYDVSGKPPATIEWE